MIVQPSTKTLNQMVDLLAADSVTWKGVAVTNLITVGLLKADFTPANVLTVADLPAAADFGGYGRIQAELGNAQTAIDPATRDRLVQLVPPVGGWRWEASSTTNLPQTIYGWEAQQGADTVLLACGKFDTPIMLIGVGDFIVLDDAAIRLLLTGVA